MIWKRTVMDASLQMALVALILAVGTGAHFLMAAHTALMECLHSVQKAELSGFRIVAFAAGRDALIQIFRMMAGRTFQSVAFGMGLMFKHNFPALVVEEHPDRRCPFGRGQVITCSRQESQQNGQQNNGIQSFFHAQLSLFGMISRGKAFFQSRWG